MEIINSFGINIYLLVAQIVNFLILLYLLKRFAYKPILKMLSDRRETIKEGYKNAEAAQKLLDNATDKEKLILKEAEQTAESLMKDTKDQAAQILEDARNKALSATERMLKDAKEQMQMDYKQAEKRLAENTYKLAVEVLKSALSNTVNEDLQESIIKKFMKDNKKI